MGVKTGKQSGLSILQHKALAKGLNIVKGKIVYKEISEAFNLKLQPL